MPVNKTTTRKIRQPKTSPRSAAYASSTFSIAAQNLINMVVVSAFSGAVLLAMLAARHF
jgi:hypothetical protein